MDKLNFKTREVVAVIIATTVYVLCEWCEQKLIAYGYVSTSIIDWFKIRTLVVMITSAMFGPLVGIICGLGGALIVNVSFYGYVDAVEVSAYALNGFFMGRYAGKLGVLEGKFRKYAIIDFNAIQIMTNTICSVLFCPLFLFILYKTPIDDSVMLGLTNAIGITIQTGIIGTPVLYLVSRYCRRR